MKNINVAKVVKLILAAYVIVDLLRCFGPVLFWVAVLCVCTVLPILLFHWSFKVTGTVLADCLNWAVSKFKGNG